MGAQIWTADRIFDGHSLLNGHGVVVSAGQVMAVAPLADLRQDQSILDLGPGVLCPGFVDLQVNGGGGVMLNDGPTVAHLHRISAAHASLGSTAFLPTLITDRPEVTQAAISAVENAQKANVPGILGLHLEGPHLDRHRCGAHDPDLMRPMTERDLRSYLEARVRVGVLKLTVAPNVVMPDQIRALVKGGVIVSLGHSDASFAQTEAAIAAGATCITHLFNAMSGLGHRAPGLAGAALADERVAVGLIADGVHVHPAALTIAARAKQAPGGVYLVSDAMAVAGTDLDGFMLQDRQITRAGGELRLSDGTLAGADLALGRAVQVMVQHSGVSLERALQMVTQAPARAIGLSGSLGRFAPGLMADAVLLRDDFSVGGVWRDGVRLQKMKHLGSLR